MSAFTGELRLASLDADCRVWRLEEPLQYEIGELGSGALIVVPAGFETDGASIPRLLQGVLPAWGRWSRAAIVHDYLCRQLGEGRQHTFVIDQSGPGAVERVQIVWTVRTRRHADDIFHEALIVCEVPRPLAWIMWAAVRLADRFPALRNASAV